jgi:hypothetical protein
MKKYRGIPWSPDAEQGAGCVVVICDGYVKLKLKTSRPEKMRARCHTQILRNDAGATLAAMVTTALQSGIAFLRIAIPL